MKLTRLGHATLLVETSNARLLIDPGNYSTDWHGLTDLDAILVTHQHGDHVDLNNIGTLLDANPAAQLVVEQAVVELLDARSPKAVEVGQTIEIGDVKVEVVGGEHAIIHDRISRVGNVGFVVQETDGPTLFHPGDSFATAPSGVDVLALPLAAPWAKVAMTVDFANAVKPRLAIPIHDATLSQAGRPTYMRMSRGVIDESITIDDPAIGELYSV